MALPSIYYVTQTISDLPDHFDWLGKSERSVLSGMRFPKRRQEWLLGRWTGKQAIFGYPDLDLRSWSLSGCAIVAAQDGAPEAFVNDRKLPLSVSISHSQGQALSAVGPDTISVGCDIELVTTAVLSVVHDFFNSEEIETLARTAEDERQLFATLVWSAKESTLKVLREGLRRDTRSVTIEFASERPGAWSEWKGLCVNLNRRFSGWWRHTGGYIWTIAASEETPIPEALQALQGRK